MNFKNIFKGLSVAVLTVVVLLSCQKQESVEETILSVEPASKIEFEAKGNAAVVLTVNTDAEEWSFTAPDWLVTAKSDNVLSVTAEDNVTGITREGFVVFSAGNAKDVKIAVSQKADSGSDGVDKTNASINDASESGDAKIVLSKEMTVKATLRLSLEQALKNDAVVKISVDENYIKEYDYVNKTKSTLLPGYAPTFPQTLTVKAGETEVTIELNVDGDVLTHNTHYLLPLKAEAVSENISFKNNSALRVNYSVLKQVQKQIRQLALVEINNTNPLNVLEYKLEDGSYFFDAVVLFAGNIGWRDEDKAVRFNQRTGEDVINPNINALVTDWELYMRPVREAGIKVYLGVVPHWTNAGFTTLSANGCKMIAEDIAEIVQTCQLDGVFLDEEYVKDDGYAMTDIWGADPDVSGSYAVYQMKKQMGALIKDRPVDVGVFQFGKLSLQSVTDHETGAVVDPSDYCDIVMPNYNGAAAIPAGKQTKKNMVGRSIECNMNFGRIKSEADAKSIQDEGYGWIAWFAWDPVIPGREEWEMINFASKGCYDESVVPATGFYKKIGEGQYDPTRYEK